MGIMLSESRARNVIERVFWRLAAKSIRDCSKSMDYGMKTYRVRCYTVNWRGRIAMILESRLELCSRVVFAGRTNGLESSLLYGEKADSSYELA